MSVPSLSATDQGSIGNTAGWHLSFHRAKSEGKAVFPDDDSVLELGSGDYYAEIRASLPEGPEGGVYSFVVEGLTDEHYKAVARKKGAPDFVRLYLYWMDTNSSVAGYLQNVAGMTGAFGVKGADIPDALVAVLKILSVSRRAGTRRYETTITAQEWVYERVRSSSLCGEPISKDTLEEALHLLLGESAHLRKNKDYRFHGSQPDPANPPQPSSAGAKPKTEIPAGGRSVRDLLLELGGKLEEESGRYGRGMFLVRDGCLHVGTRPIPFEGEGKGPKKLTLGGGLIEVEALPPVGTDPNLDQVADPGKKPPRRQFKLTLKGRPDLKPGDLVEFDAPPEDVDTTGSNWLGAIGDLAAGPLLPSLGDAKFQHPVQLYVASVEHRLGRTSGFVTTLTGLEIQDPQAKWDSRTPVRRPAAGPEPAHASPETEAARAVRNVAHGALASKSLAEVGEVRAMTSSGTAEPPGQTLKIWRGVKPGDPQGYRARRSPIQRPSSAPAEAAPYATPFAWGKCGLVLPRYPGTRVVVVHPDGSSDDPIDIGALWESGKGPDSQPGDWWLILPVDVPQAQRGSLQDTDTPQEHTGKVTQDLIDAEGNRVIEAGELTIRVGRADLKSAGQRPARGDTDSVTIEHTGGKAKVVIDQNGKVTITAKSIVLDAGSDGTISMTAKKVDVQVSDCMDVHG